MDVAEGAAEASRVQGVAAVLAVEGPVSAACNTPIARCSLRPQEYASRSPEVMALTVSSLASGAGFKYVLAASSGWTKTTLFRAAAQLGSAPLTDVTKVLGDDRFERPMYAGSAVATVRMTDAIKVQNSAV